MQKLFVMVGLPLSGKTTYSEYLRRITCATIVNPDTVRLAIHGNQYIQTAEPFVWATTETMVRTLLMSDHSVILDAVNNTKERRSVWVRMAKEFDLTAKFCVMQTTYEDCLRRNTDLNRLDPSIITKMYEKYQRVTEDEGQVIISTGVPSHIGD
jgi:predicted kinase